MLTKFIFALKMMKQKYTYLSTKYNKKFIIPCQVKNSLFTKYLQRGLNYELKFYTYKYKQEDIHQNYLGQLLYTQQDDR